MSGIGKQWGAFLHMVNAPESCSSHERGSEGMTWGTERATSGTDRATAKVAEKEENLKATQQAQQGLAEPGR